MSTPIELTQEHKNILNNPNLIPLIIKEAHKLIVREDDTLIALIIINWVRFVKNSQPTSSNVLINSYTRSGKDYIAKNLYPIICPKDKYIHQSKISKEAFTYWHHEEPDWTWDGKQLHLEDASSDLMNSSVFKTMSSGSNTAAVVVKNRTVEFDVPGKPNITITGYNINPNQEAIGRYPIVHMDESKEQTHAIKIYKSILESGKINQTKNFILRDAIQSLKPVEVIVPFAEKLPSLFPDSILMRDAFGRFLDYIKASAAGHQYQRNKDEKERIIATYDDYLIARIVLMKTYSNKHMISTTNKDEKIIEFLEKNGPSTKPEIEEGAGVSRWYCYGGGGLEKLVDNGLLKTNLIYKEKANKKVTHYLVSHESGSIGLPLIPEGIVIDTEIREYINGLRDPETVIPTLNSDFECCGLNKYSGITVLRYLLKKGKEYFDTDMANNINIKSTVEPKYPPSQGYYVRYLGINIDSDNEEKEEIIIDIDDV